jgi:hypothetical protein
LAYGKRQTGLENTKTVCVVMGITTQTVLLRLSLLSPLLTAHCAISALHATLADAIAARCH